jgi:hypothetical protein
MRVRSEYFKNLARSQLSALTSRAVNRATDSTAWQSRHG